ncbi:MAG: tRNA pseudouridine(38-40) synthase TruA [Eubacteriales bacterium]|jgi:tRNA pseudouridine38-40 synthase|nr:tRNA pseudouridine(38-40) synthase TruA [Eubacteriales bacterium]
MNILLKLSFLGTNYSGFQVQKNALTVQERLQDAVESVFGYRCPLTGCGRTDSGVHAKEFYCTINTACAPNNISAGIIPDALNHHLPHDISIIEAAEVSDSFHPRYDVIRKEYLYLIWNERYPNPFFTDRAYHYVRPLEAEKMNESAAHLIGIHDFTAFMAAGSSVTDTIREIYDARVTRENSFIKIIINGNGFLYNMMRIISGTLIYISEGKIPSDAIPRIIEGKNRVAAGFTVPAHGLYLNRVVYKTDA